MGITRLVMGLAGAPVTASAAIGGALFLVIAACLPHEDDEDDPWR